MTPHKPRFQLTRRGHNTLDDVGTIQIQVGLRDSTNPSVLRKGNIVRQLTVYDAKVSDVIEFIRQALEQS